MKTAFVTTDAAEATASNGGPKMNIFQLSTSVPRDPQQLRWPEPSGTDATMHYTVGKKASAEGRRCDFL